MRLLALPTLIGYNSGHENHERGGLPEASGAARQSAVPAT